MDISTYQDLRDTFVLIREFRPRFGVATVTDFIMRNRYPVICGIIGLRRTGKTTMMWQAMMGLPKIEQDRSLYIVMEDGDDMVDLKIALKEYRARGFTNFFIDEITRLHDFSKKGSVLADVYAAYGLRIVISGTDSLLLEIAKRSTLFDRVISVRTTWMPWREHAAIAGGSCSFDDYLENGGILPADGEWRTEVGQYVRTSIVDNLINSLDRDRDGTNYDELAGLWNRGELKDFVLRVLNDNTHRFLAKLLKKRLALPEFETAGGIAREGSPNVGRQEADAIFSAIKKRIGYIDRSPDHPIPEQEQVDAVREWLETMDVFISEPVMPKMEDRPSLLSQPALRWHQVLNVIDAILANRGFASTFAKDVPAMKEMLTSALKGEILEDIVLIDTMKTLSGYGVISLKFPARFYAREGEFDMVVTRQDKHRIPRECDIFEIKKSRNPSWKQGMHLRRREYIGYLEGSHCPVRHRIVLYQGPEFIDFDGIMYLSVENFLFELPRYEEMLAEKCEMLETARDAHDRHAAAWIAKNLGEDGLRERIDAYCDRPGHESEIPFADWLRMKGTKIPMPWETGGGAGKATLPGGWESWTRLQEAVFIEREGETTPEENFIRP